LQGAPFIVLLSAPNAGTIKDYSQIAQIHDYILSLPDKYNTLCGQRGSSLSGGQQQRLVIARALLRQPELLLLDEATSALDAETEEAVVSALDRWKDQTGATLLIITHRIRTVRNCDAAIVLHQGKVR
jgi:ATP-binding cassette, subfamily B (MDR/TAP), member 1